MRKFFNKPLAEYNLKDLTVIMGLSLLAVPVMWGFSLGAITKTEEWEANRRRRKRFEEANEGQESTDWFSSEEKEEP